MRRSMVWRRLSPSAYLLAGALLALSAPSSAAAAHASKPPPPPKPRAITGKVAHVRGNSALLEGVVNPQGAETTYFFQYGPTIAYGSQTPSANAGAGSVNVKVGQTASPFLVGYHYRLVATNVNGTSPGADRQFKNTTSSRPKVEITKPSGPAVYGSAVTVSGVLTGPNAPNHKIVLQASPFPYVEAFSSVGLPSLTSALGRFSFHVASLTTTTQVRVITLDALPMFSAVVTEQVAPRVSFKVRSAGRQGLVRLYGTITPAAVGARVFFQLEKAVRPNGRSEKAEETTRKFVTQSSTVAKRATRAMSRFSSVVSITRTGRYRAFVRLRSGALVSGASQQSVVIHAAPARKAHAKKH
jgi:hypothetical protein